MMPSILGWMFTRQRSLPQFWLAELLYRDKVKSVYHGALIGPRH